MPDRKAIRIGDDVNDLTYQEFGPTDIAIQGGSKNPSGDLTFEDINLGLKTLTQLSKEADDVFTLIDTVDGSADVRFRARGQFGGFTIDKPNSASGFFSLMPNSQTLQWLGADPAAGSGVNQWFLDVDNQGSLKLNTLPGAGRSGIIHLGFSNDVFPADTDNSSRLGIPGNTWGEIHADDIFGKAITVSANDTTPGRLIDKLVAGTGITLTEQNDGANETLQIDGTESKSVCEEINQTTHGFSVGDVIQHNGTSYVKAQADVAANSEAVGVISSVADVDNFTVCYSGRINGLSGLTAGHVYFLSDSVAGGVTTTSPEISKPIFVATSTTSAVIHILRGLDSEEETSNIIVQDDGTTLTTAVKKLNFVGFTVTEPVTDEITIENTGGLSGVAKFIINACQFDNPVNGDWPVNNLAPSATDSNSNALTVRRFDDTSNEGVGFLLDIPSGATNIIFNFRSRAETAPGGAVVAKVGIYEREIPDNAAVTAWSSLQSLIDIDLPTNENFQYDSVTSTLASLGLTAGSTHQFELVRDAANVGDTLVGDWSLLQISVEYS